MTRLPHFQLFIDGTWCEGTDGHVMESRNPATGQVWSTFACAAPQDIDRAIALIRKAKRPAMVCGGGVHWSGATAEVTAFAERLGGLVVTSLSGKGSVP